MGERISGVAPWRRYPRVVRIANPAVGHDWSAVVPAGRLWDVVSLLATLTTSSVAASRIPYLYATDGTTKFGLFLPGYVAAASLTYPFSWYPEANITNVSGGSPAAQSSIARLRLQAGYTLGPTTANIDVGDQWSGIALFVWETLFRQGDIDISEVPELVVQLAPGGMGGAAG